MLCGDREGGPYSEMLRAAEAHEGRLRRWEGTPEDVARTIVAAFESERPKARYPVTFMARLLPALRLLLPTRWNDSLNAANMGSGRRPEESTRQRFNPPAA